MTEILWSFSIFLESVAILPQLFMLSRTGEAETITTHYLFALGAYRALYIPQLGLPVSSNRRFRFPTSQRWKTAPRCRVGMVTSVC